MVVDHNHNDRAAEAVDILDRVELGPVEENAADLAAAFVDQDLVGLVPVAVISSI